MKIIRSVEVKDSFSVKASLDAEILGVYQLGNKAYVSILDDDPEASATGSPEVVVEATTYKFLSVKGKNIPDGIEHDGESLIYVGAYVDEDSPVHVFEVVS